jgi:alpha-beta hydrolase superfamily lysophospholipase
MLKDLSILPLEGISLVGQLLLPDLEGNYPLLCLCHGAPSGEPPRPDDGGYPELAEKLCRNGLAVFWFNFRGTGDSGGNMDPAGWTRDLQAVLDYLWGLDNFDKSRLSLVGFSLGAAVAIYVASKDTRVSGVVACACPAEITPFEQGNWRALVDHFREIGAIRDDDFPPSLEEWVAGCQRIHPFNRIAAIAPRPVLIIHGSQDSTVSVEDAQRLYEKAGLPKRLVILDGAGHRLRSDKRVIDTIVNWIKPG